MMSWKSQLETLQNAAKVQLVVLQKEMEEIYTLFPSMRPATTQKIRRLYHGTHWMQQPQNAAKVRAMVDKMIAGGAKWREGK